MNNLYKEIFKRKSFHLYRCNTYPLTQTELDDICDVYSKLTPLYPDIRTEIRIVKASETNCRRGEEYCIEIFSEVKDNYLMNAGYLGEQLDLYLASRNIGTLWFGIGKEKDSFDGLDFVIMMAIAKVDEESFRKDMYKSKRKELSEIWKGKTYGFSDIIRFAPSACNIQPWFVKSEDDTLTVYRYRKLNKRGIMPINSVKYYNRIDIGIFLLFLDVCLKENDIKFERELFTDEFDADAEYTKVAVYHI